jgi:hypothetical protein
LSLADLEIAFGEGDSVAFADDAPDASASVLAEIADAVTDAIEALEERLDRIERGLPGRLQ